MKEILILVSKFGKKKKTLASKLQKHLGEKALVSLARFDDLLIRVEKGKIEIKVGKKDIKDFSLVYFRRIGVDFFPIARTLGFALNYLKIPFFDNIFGQPGSLGDKLTSQIRLATAGLPIIPLIYCSRKKVLEKQEFVIANFGLPLVAKHCEFHRGKGVILIKKREDFLKILRANFEGEFFFQKYCPAEKEYRILVLGDKARVWEAKIPTKTGEFRSNVYLGAKEEFYKINSLPPAMAKIAIKAAKTLNIQIAGIDILKEKSTGKIWLLEVNRGPGFTYDEKKSPEIKELANFLLSQL